MSLRSSLTVKPIRVQRVIHASADDLWALFANPHRHPDLDGHGLADLIPGTTYGPQRLQAGDTFSVHMRYGPFTYVMNLFCVQSRPGKEVAWKSLAPALWRWSFKPLRPRQTLVTGEWIPLRRAYAPLFALIGAPTKNRQGLVGTLNRLEELVAEMPHTS
ncbi:hypothetical protein [Stomatohabitans albus]|uniref:hypothetical protein n=1 Tax=Stomatohabitans albus TaxID=3110766 RepID=UPI00300C7DE1